MNLPEVCNTKNVSGNGWDNELDLEPKCVRVLRLEPVRWFEVELSLPHWRSGFDLCQLENPVHGLLDIECA